MDGTAGNVRLLRMVRRSEMPGPNRLREWREAAGLSQEELAELLGTSNVTISRYETGVRVLTIDHLHQIAPVLGCQPADLLPNGDSVLTDDERRWVRAYADLGDGDREALLRLALSLSGQPAAGRRRPARLRRKIG